MQKEKQALREAMTYRILKMSEKERAAESRSICRRLEERFLSFIDEKKIAVAAYYPLKTEVDIRLFLRNLIFQNIPIFLPRLESGTNVFRRVKDFSTLTKGGFGIPEPSINEEEIPEDSQLIVLIPGRAFTVKGERLGRGNGGYDHWIRAQRKIHPDMECWGVCFECQIVQNIPTEPHDARLDHVVTCRGYGNSVKFC